MRRFVFAFAAFALLAQGANRRDLLDPAFDKIPFARWLGEGNQTSLPYMASVTRAELTFHQRLMIETRITLDGRDLETRRADGELVYFIQLSDEAGTRFQGHNSVELVNLDQNVKGAIIQLSMAAFVLPGDYQLAVVLLDTGKGDHSAALSRFRVTSPTRQLLPDEWNGLPSVEFIQSHESPESWFLPDIQGRLQWAARVQSPARVNVIVGITKPAVAPGARPVPSAGMAALIPTLKVITETGAPSISEHVEVLDLARRRPAYEQDHVQSLDWPGLKIALSESNTASIDVHSLAERHHDAQYFVTQVRNNLRSPEKPTVLVILATALAFESGEDLSPISLEALPPCRVIYIRYRPSSHLESPFEGMRGRGMGRGSRMGGPMGRGLSNTVIADQLAGTLKPLNPKIIDVGTPEEMAKAIAEIEKTLVTSSSK